MQRLLFALLVCYCFSAFAEEERNLFDMSLEELLQVEVTGVTLKQQSQLMTPASVNVFDEAAIARTGAANLSELIRFIPGLQIYRTDDTNVDSLAIRGRNSSNSMREVLLLINGMRVANSYNNSGFLTIGRMDTRLIEKVEFIRGPSSQLYGSNAFLGVINITTKQGKTDLQISRGTHKTYQFAGNLAWQTASAQHQLSVSVLDDDGESYTIEDRLNDRSVTYRDPMKRQELHYRLKNQDVALDVTLDHKHSEDYLAAGAVWPGFNDRESEFISWNLSYELPMPEDLDSTFEIGSRFYHDHRKVPLAAAGSLLQISEPQSSEPLLAKTDLYERAYWLKLRNHFATTTADYMVQLEWQRNNTDAVDVANNYDIEQLTQGDFPIAYYGNFDNKTRALPDVERDQYALIGQYIRRLTGHTELTFGLRYDDYSDIGGKLSSRIGLVHMLSSEDTVKLIYGEAYRAPTVFELYSQSNTQLVGDPNLEAEEVKTIELIWNSHRHDGSRYKASLFHNQFIHPIVQVPEDDGLRYYRNGQDSESSGLELLALQPLSDNWLVRLSGSYLFKIARDMPAVAHGQANLALAYSSDAYSATLDWDYVGSRAFNNAQNVRQRIGSQWVLNLSTSYSLAPYGRLHFKAKNLTDKETYAPATSAAKQATPNRGAEFWLSYSKQFD